MPPVDAPKAVTPKVDTPNADLPAPLPAVDQSAKPDDPKQDAQIPRNLVPEQKPDVDGSAAGEKQPPAAGQAQSDPSTVSKAAQRIATAEPETLTAPEQDVQLAKQSNPIEVKPEPASKQDVDFLASAINLQSKTKLGPFESEFGAGSEFSVGGDRDRDRGRDWENKYWDKKVRQWDRDWIEYDRFYRPIIFNPFRAPVRIVYALANATRILVIQPLARVVVDVAELAAYSFTAVVLGAANVVSDVANVAADVVNVAVGTFFGGGYIPPIGAPFVRRRRCCATTTCRFRCGTRTRHTSRSGSTRSSTSATTSSTADGRCCSTARRLHGGSGPRRRRASASSRSIAHSSTPDWANRKKRRCPATIRCGWPLTSPPTSTARRCT